MTVDPGGTAPLNISFPPSPLSPALLVSWFLCHGSITLSSVCVSLFFKRQIGKSTSNPE